jgi:pyruvate kinase
VKKTGVIVTVPPHATFLEEVAAHPVVVGLRLNTVMPIKGTIEETLTRLSSLGQPLWIDLKGRQLRVAEAAVPPFTAVRLSHRISVRTPARAIFSGGREEARVLAVDGDRLILEDGPRRVLGPGESVNLPCASLTIEGTLTARDEDYVRAARGLGLHDFMLSFVEQQEDVEAVRALDPEARVVAKIESQRGLAYAREHGGGDVRLMTARGDLFLELARPHHLLRAMKDVLAADPDAIVASRICDSLAWGLEPTSQDITDAAYLLSLGYRTLLLGDEVCLKRDSVLSALNLLEAIAG